MAEQDDGHRRAKKQASTPAVGSKGGIGREKKSPKPLRLGAESTVRGGGGDNWCATVGYATVGIAGENLGELTHGAHCSIG